MSSSKYMFDMRIGHYIRKPLNEKNVGLDKLTKDTADGEEAEKEKDIDAAATTLINAVDIENAPKIIERKNALNNRMLQFDREILIKKNNIVKCELLLATALNDPKSSTLTAIAKLLQLIQANYELESKMFDKAKIYFDNMKLIFQELKSLLSSAGKEVAESHEYNMPEKYRYLNESNIQNAKIHLDKIIKDDIQERIKGMVDFKKAFSKSNLLYGKDKDGYFAVCVDQADFNKLTSTLEEAGYLRDDILSATLPLIFDRSNLTK